MIGQSIGPYQIFDKLGAGGMGEVYRARDSKLKRDVAVKVLPEAGRRRSGIRKAMSSSIATPTR